jgi:hypothetical protein
VRSLNRDNNVAVVAVVALVGVIATACILACAPTPRVDIGVTYLAELGESEAPMNAVAAPEMLFEVFLEHPAIYTVELTDMQMNTCDGRKVGFDLSLKHERAKVSVYLAEIGTTIPNESCSTWLQLTVETTRTVGDPLPETVRKNIPIEIYPK